MNKHSAICNYSYCKREALRPIKPYRVDGKDCLPFKAEKTVLPHLSKEEGGSPLNTLLWFSKFKILMLSHFNCFLLWHISTKYTLHCDFPPSIWHWVPFSFLIIFSGPLLEKRKNIFLHIYGTFLYNFLNSSLLFVIYIRLKKEKMFCSF